MIRKYLFFLLFFYGLSCLASIKIIDDSGQTISFLKPAHRIISLAPNITEILYAIGAGNDVVGVSDYSNYPAAAKKLPIVATASEINIEEILALHPDLIIAWKGGNSAAQLATLQHYGVQIYQAKFINISDISRTMENIAILTGHQKSAQNVIQSLQQGFQQLQKLYAKQKKVTVFFELWSNPLMTLNHQSMINSVISLCGGKNIFADAITQAPIISEESVLQNNPDVFLSTIANNDWYANWLRFTEIKAVQKKQFYQIPADLLERPGPRMLQGAQMVCADLEKAR